MYSIINLLTTYRISSVSVQKNEIKRIIKGLMSWKFDTAELIFLS